MTTRKNAGPRKPHVTDGNGYIYILVHGHPGANSRHYVREHVLVWEKDHQVQLPLGWVVHHINGIVDDNRPANLRAFSRSQHTRFHSFARREHGLGNGACLKSRLAEDLERWDSLRRKPQPVLKGILA